MRPRSALDPYWMMAPTAALIGLFFFYPIGYAFVQSFYAWDLLTQPRYVGFDNYELLFESGVLLEVFWTTLKLSVVVVLGSMALGLFMAVLLNRPGPFFAFVRSAVFSAYVVSWVSVALLFLWVLDADAGVVNNLLRGVGLPAPNWLGDPDVALYSIAGVTIWKIAGYAMVLFIAGLQDVPPTLLEAAALDGAGSGRRFLFVTWPLLRPKITVSLPKLSSMQSGCISFFHSVFGMWNCYCISVGLSSVMKQCGIGLTNLVPSLPSKSVRSGGQQPTNGISMRSL
jgi:sn-glycerol 3-phosphate transport system permease protein